MNFNPNASQGLVRGFSRKCFILVLLGSACLSMALITACSFPPRLYRMDVRQGNYITPEMVAKLRIGMTKDAVREVMGTPTLESFFKIDQWHYYHYFKPGNGDPIVEMHVTIYFKDGKVSRLEGVEGVGAD